MASNKRGNASPRGQAYEDPVLRRRPTVNKTNNACGASKLLCCICDDKQDTLNGVIDCEKKPGEKLAETHGSQRKADRQDPSSRTTQRWPIQKGQKSRIWYHREGGAGGTAQVLYGAADASSPMLSDVSTSDSEYYDARDHFSERESEVEAAPETEVPPLQRCEPTSILKRCRCATCRGVMRQLGRSDSFRNADVCRAQRKDAAVKIHLKVKVAKYDIGTGDMKEEWVEDLNLKEEKRPIGIMRNPSVEQDIEARRTQARVSLRTLFNADRFVNMENEEYGNDLEADEREEDVELNENVDDGRLELRTRGNQGLE